MCRGTLTQHEPGLNIRNCTNPKPYLNANVSLRLNMTRCELKEASSTMLWKSTKSFATTGCQSLQSHPTGFQLQCASATHRQTQTRCREFLFGDSRRAAWQHLPKRDSASAGSCYHSHLQSACLVRSSLAYFGLPQPTSHQLQLHRFRYCCQSLWTCMISGNRFRYCRQSLWTCMMSGNRSASPVVSFALAVCAVDPAFLEKPLWPKLLPRSAAVLSWRTWCRHAQVAKRVIQAISSGKT